MLCVRTDQRYPFFACSFVSRSIDLPSFYLLLVCSFYDLNQIKLSWMFFFLMNYLSMAASQRLPNLEDRTNGPFFGH